MSRACGRLSGMRWHALFDDLEGQLEVAQAAELAGEVAERVRVAAARVTAAQRWSAAAGRGVVVALPGAGVVRGAVVDSGPDWALVAEGSGREALVPLGAVLSVSGLPAAPAPTEQPAEERVARALDLRWALRGLARDRAGVSVVLVDGSALSGTVDRVGADHLDLALHGAGEARRAREVRDVRLVPLAAVALVRSG